MCPISDPLCPSNQIYIFVNTELNTSVFKWCTLSRFTTLVCSSFSADIPLDATQYDLLLLNPVMIMDTTLSRSIGVQLIDERNKLWTKCETMTILMEQRPQTSPFVKQWTSEFKVNELIMSARSFSSEWTELWTTVDVCKCEWNE